MALDDGAQGVAGRQRQHLVPQPARQQDGMAAPHGIAGDDQRLAAAVVEGPQHLLHHGQLHLRLVGQGQQRAGAGRMAAARPAWIDDNISPLA